MATPQAVIAEAPCVRASLLDCLVLSGGVQQVGADPGDLDPAFGNHGKVLTDFSGSGSSDRINSIAIQSDGKIVAVGSSDAFDGTKRFAVARYNTDGSLDTGFGTGGKVIVTSFDSPAQTGASEATTLIFLAAGKILVGGDVFMSNLGKTTTVVARFDSSGNLDSTFGSGGTAVIGFENLFAAGLVLGPGGELLVAGYGHPPAFEPQLFEYSMSGCEQFFEIPGNPEVDTILDQAFSFISLGGGKYLYAGFTDANGSKDFALLRVVSGSNQSSCSASFGLAADGTFGDPSTGFVFTDFSGTGSTDIANAAAAQSDGMVIAAGVSDANGTNDFALGPL